MAKRLVSRFLTTGRFVRNSKFKDGVNHAVKTTNNFQSATNNKR